MNIVKHLAVSLIVLFLSFAAFSQTWLTDLDEGFEQARQDDKLLLLVFSGSDWCAPCIRLKTQVLDTKVFLDYAAHNLVLVNIDFPRKKKNRPDADIAERNKFVAEKYNPRGSFPWVLLFRSDGEENLVIDHSSMEPGFFLEEIERKRNEMGL